MEEWFVLNYVPGPGFRRHTLPELIARFSRHEGAALELFAPTFVAITTDRGKVKRVERPLLFHYIFLRGTEAAVKRLCQTHEGFSFVIDHAGSRRHLTLPDETVAQYRIIARYYGNNLPYYPLAEVNLEEGDKVEVVDGPLAGLRGTYMSRRGGKSGNILLAVDHQMAAIVYDVKAQYVRVLEFARDSRRAYDQIDAFTLHLLTILSPTPASPQGEELGRASQHSLPCGEGRGGAGSHGIKMASPDIYPQLKEKAREMRKNMTDGEKAVWQIVSGKALKAKFRRQHIVGDYILDFVDLDSGLVIEVDGGYHNEPEQQEYDRLRTEFLERHGFKVIRFTNAEVIGDPSAVKKKIEASLSQLKASLSLPCGEGRGGASLSLPCGEGRGGAGSLAQLQVFTRRLGAVRLHNPKLDAKLQLLLTAAYTLLGDAENAARARERFDALSHHITNPKTLALVARLLPLPCGEGRGGASSLLLGAPRSPIQRAIARLLQDKSINN